MNLASTTPLLLALLLLLVIVAFSSGTEVAMLSVNRYRIRHRARAGHGTARTLERLLQKPDEWLGANLVILAAASVFASAIAPSSRSAAATHYAVPLAGAALTIVVIVFCELAPKIYAASNPEGVALHAAGIYRVLVLVARPALWLTNTLAYGFLRIFGVGRRRAAARPQRRGAAHGGDRGGAVIPARHRQMLLSILDLGRVTVNDIMIPRQEIAASTCSESWEDILDQLRQTPHTRLPVYDGELDNLIGLLHMKRVANELVRGTLTRERLIEIARGREPYFVPEGTALNVQLGLLPAQPAPPGIRRQRVRRHRGAGHARGHARGDRRRIHHRSRHHDPQGRARRAPRRVHRQRQRHHPCAQSRPRWQLPTGGPKTVNGLLLEHLETIPDTGTDAAGRSLRVRGAADRGQRHPHGAGARRRGRPASG